MAKKAKQKEVHCHICGERIKVPRGQADASIDCPACGTGLSMPKVGQRKRSLQTPVKGRKLRAGTKLGTFVIKRQINAGNMGTVYLAKQTSMGRMVAVKVLPPAMAQDRNHIKRFLAEVQLQAKLDHPGIVPAFEAGFDKNVYFLAMAYVDGESLAAKMEREKTISEREALQTALQVAEALAYAWDEHQMLHRDIKPTNIMIDRKGIVRLLDLGISKCISDNVTLTASDSICGTPVYMSPEQAMGDPKLDWRTDIYALGATLYHALTGEFPFGGQNVEEILYKHIHEPLKVPMARNGEFSVDCSALICKMMKKQPAERHADWHELIAEVRKLLNVPAANVAVVAEAPPATPEEPPAAQPTKAPEEPRQKARKKLRKKTRKKPREIKWPVFRGVLLGTVLPALVTVASYRIFARRLMFFGFKTAGQILMSTPPSVRLAELRAVHGKTHTLNAGELSLGPMPRGGFSLAREKQKNLIISCQLLLESGGEGGLLFLPRVPADPAAAWKQNLPGAIKICLRRKKRRNELAILRQSGKKTKAMKFPLAGDGTDWTRLTVCKNGNALVISEVFGQDIPIPRVWVNSGAKNKAERIAAVYWGIYAAKNAKLRVRIPPQMTKAEKNRIRVSFGNKGLTLDFGARGKLKNTRIHLNLKPAGLDVHVDKASNNDRE